MLPREWEPTYWDNLEILAPASKEFEIISFAMCALCQAFEWKESAPPIEIRADRNFYGTTQYFCTFNNSGMRQASLEMLKPYITQEVF